MIKQSSWIGGNSLVILSPECVESLRHYSWGIKIGVTPLQGGWFSIAIPTPVILKDDRSKVQKLFLLFNCLEDYPSSIRIVRIWDGPNLVQELPNLDLKGNHSAQIDASNTFTLTDPHDVLFGMSIAFYFQGGNKTPPGTPGDWVGERIKFTVTGAGADFF